MRRTTVLCGALAVILAGSFAGAASPAERAGEGWPKTHPGRLAQGWVSAFSTGEEAMRDFLARSMAPKSLESSSVPRRIERYRDLREKYGKLAFASVVKSTPEKLNVKLMASDGSVHEFIFTAQSEAPHKLVSVAIRQQAHGHGFGGGHP
jgi:hypothetical protein